MKKIYLILLIVTLYITVCFAGGSSGKSTSVRITDGTSNVKVDSIVNAIRTISTPHAEVHAGDMHIYSTVDTSLADEDSLVIYLSTSAKSSHITIGILCGGDGYGYMYENPNCTFGTIQSVYNANRTSDETASITVGLAPVITSSGTLINSSYSSGGQKNFAVGGAIRSGTELILDGTKDYLIVFTNDAGSAKPVSANLEWYEE